MNTHRWTCVVFLLSGVLGFDVHPESVFNGTADAEFEAPEIHLALPSPLVSASLPSSAHLFVQPHIDKSSVRLVVLPSTARRACPIDWNQSHGVVHLQECATPLPAYDVKQHHDQSPQQLYRISVTAVATDLRTVTYNREVLVINVNPRPWPFSNPPSNQWPPSEPNLVGNIMENYQSFSGANSAYMHQGIDIRSYALQELHSPTSGRCVRRVNYSGGSSLYWSVMVLDGDGFVWQFHHLDPNTITVNEGDLVEQGDVLGEIHIWPASHNGVLYHHIHMNVAWPQQSWTSFPLPYVDGWRYYNPFDFLQRLTDNEDEGPFSDEVFYFHPNEQPNQGYDSTQGSQAVVYGQTDIVVQLHSLYEETNNLGGHPYINGLYSISYEIIPAPNCGAGCVRVPETFLAHFDTFPGDWPYNQPDYEVWRSDEMLRRIYCQQFRVGTTSYTSVFNYNTRRLYYTVTNTHNGQPDAAQGFWDTAAGDNGEYDVTVRAADWYGRSMEVTHRVRVQN